jgi:hypothetical protein
LNFERFGAMPRELIEKENCVSAAGDFGCEFERMAPVWQAGATRTALIPLRGIPRRTGQDCGAAHLDGHTNVGAKAAFDHFVYGPGTTRLSPC